MSRHKTPRIPVTADRLRMITVLAAGLVTVAVNAARPKIVVGIVVDGLHQEYIDLLRGDFGQDGFNRLLNNGIVFENVDYGPGLDATAATAAMSRMMTSRSMRLSFPNRRPFSSMIFI